MRLNSKMTDEEKKSRVNGIIRLRNLRFTYAEIGERYGITRQRAQQIHKRHLEKLAQEKAGNDE